MAKKSTHLLRWVVTFTTLFFCVAALALALDDGNNKDSNGSALATEGLFFALETADLELLNHSLKQGGETEARDKRPEQHTPLLLAARFGMFDFLIALIDAGADVDARTEQGWTALMFTSHKGFTRMAETLVKHGADVNAAEKTSTTTALILAAAQPHGDIVRLLLANQANPNAMEFPHGRSALLYAAEKRTGLDTVVDLVAAGADVNLGSIDGWTPLMAASRRANLPIVEFLLLNKADAKAQTLTGETALMAAAESDAAGIMQLLITSGANLDAVQESGETAMSLAIKNNQPNAVASLIDAKANVSRHLPGGQTPLMQASATGFTEIVQLLLAAEADSNLTELKTGNTALMLAANRGFTDIVELLLTAGADPGIQAKDGWTAIEAAKMIGEDKLAKLIENWPDS